VVRGRNSAPTALCLQKQMACRVRGEKQDLYVQIVLDQERMELSDLNDVLCNGEMGKIEYWGE